jgi:hypothetical protein
MFNLLQLFLKSKRFNPYQFKSIDNGSKLVCQIDNIEFMVFVNKDKNWSIILLERELFSDWEEFTYISHKETNSKPCLITKLIIANQLINKHLKKK